MLTQLLRNHLVRFVFIFILLGKSLFANEQNVTQIHPKSGTVVFVHGFMRTSKNMSALAFSFKRDGWRVENWSYPSRKKYIEEHAKDLVNRLNQISRQEPGKPISFVTHSMGGLIVRCVLNHTDCPNEAKIGRAVLIAPPNKGSIFARKLHKFKPMRRVLGEKAGKELMTGHPKNFDRYGKFPEDMPVLVISGTAGINPMISGINDGKVSVTETRLQTDHFHESCLAGHSWICHTPSVIRKTKNFLFQESVILLR